MKPAFIKSLLIVLIASALSFHLRGQETYVTGGINVAKLGQFNDDAAQLNRILKPGLQLGTAMNLEYNDHFSFMPELQFSFMREGVEGMSFVDGGFFGNPGTAALFVSETHRKGLFTSLTLPVRFSYPLQNSKVYCLAGPFIAYQILDRTSTSVTIDGEPLQEELLMPENDEFDYGLTIGLGFARKRLIVQINYLHGFFRDIDFIGNSVYTTLKQRNSSIRLSLGFKVPSRTTKDKNPPS
ncbi:MAG: outer membrane beta-barrel protein [Cyclobacteriaceae bacterium]